MGCVLVSVVELAGVEFVINERTLSSFESSNKAMQCNITQLGEVVLEKAASFWTLSERWGGLIQIQKL